MEDEIHFLMKCTGLEDARKRLIDPLLSINPEKESMTDREKVAWLIEHAQIKEFGNALAGMYDARLDVVYKVKGRCR